jgi:hypothetical protein
MLRLTQLHLVAIVLAIAAVAAAAPARAFTQENLSAGQGGNRFADPDDQVNNFGQGATPFGSHGPVVQFGVQQGPGVYSPFNRFQGSSINSGPAPLPFSRPLGNGD